VERRHLDGVGQGGQLVAAAQAVVMSGRRDPGRQAPHRHPVIGQHYRQIGDQADGHENQAGAANVGRCEQHEEAVPDR
jgi:hypothetical protein